MINPGVISLASLQNFPNLNFPYRFEIEDNIGEAIHIHYKDIRIDLTISEFEALAKKCRSILDGLIGAPGFSTADFDPMLLTTISADLLRIERLEKREVFLEEILVDTFDDDGNKIFAPIYESRVFKAICGADKENEARFQTNYRDPLTGAPISNSERIAFNMEQIKKYGYPHGNELIGIDHLNRIWDGQHRAACLYYLYGNIKVPARTLYFADKQDAPNQEDEWLKIERELFEESKRYEEAKKIEEKLLEESKKKKSPAHILKTILKRFVWCSWKKADSIRTENLCKLSEIESRLDSIERNLDKRE